MHFLVCWLKRRFPIQWRAVPLNILKQSTISPPARWRSLYYQTYFLSPPAASLPSPSSPPLLHAAVAMRFTTFSCKTQSSITSAAATTRNVDAAIPLRSADNELQNTRELRTTAPQIAATCSSKTGSRRRRRSGKTTSSIGSCYEWALFFNDDNNVRASGLQLCWDDSITGAVHQTDGMKKRSIGTMLSALQKAFHFARFASFLAFPMLKKRISQDFFVLELHACSFRAHFWKKCRIIAKQINTQIDRKTNRQIDT